MRHFLFLCVSILIFGLALSADPKNNDSFANVIATDEEFNIYRTKVKELLDVIDQNKKDIDVFVKDAKAEYELKAKEVIEKGDLLLKRAAEFDKITAKIDEQTSNIEKQLKDLEELAISISANNEETLTKKIEEGLVSERISEHRNKMYLKTNSIIYDDLNEVYNKKIFAVGGANFDATSYLKPNNPWLSKAIIRIGFQAQDRNNGLKFTVPKDKDTLWIRCLNDRWEVFEATWQVGGTWFTSGKFTCAKRRNTEISPDGTAPDSFWDLHMWINIPVKEGEVILYSAHQSSDPWISGIAFTKNEWGHARNNALAYHWGVNGETGVEWDNEDWNRDILARIIPNSSQLRVPVIPNGKDKLIYLIEHNSDWCGIYYKSLTANGKPIERFRSTYNNPFAINFNSKIYARYVAAFVPKEYIKLDDKFIELKFDFGDSTKPIYFREIGTHDAY